MATDFENLTWRDHLRAFVRRLFGPPTPPQPPLKQILVVVRRPPPPACTWCREELGENRHPRIPTMHLECAVRSIAGPVAHIERRCGCYVPGSTEHDPPGMTVRQAALAAYQRLRERDHGPLN